MIGNSNYLQSTDFNIPNPAIVNDIDGDPSTTISTSADLILPLGSKIDYAYLTVQTGYEATPGEMTSIKFKVPGGNYLTLNSSSPQFIAAKSVLDPSPGTRKYRQIIFDVTSLLPQNGFVSTSAGGLSGRYFVADPIPNFPTNQRTNMGGWSLIVVYSNTNSLYRNITIADNWQFFGGGATTVNTDIPNIQMPGSGAVNVTIGLAGLYGDPSISGFPCNGCTDFLKFGVIGTTLTNLQDPVTGVTNDALNSTIGWSANNDVSVDSGISISGNYTARNPNSGFTPANYAPTGTWGSADYDSDIFSANGILPADGTLRNVRLSQQTTGSDYLVSGSYFISVETSALTLSKSLTSNSILDGDISAYTFSITNNTSNAVNQTNAFFTDNLPSSIVVAANANITSSCSGANVTANPGSSTISVTNLNLALNQSCNITVDVTNVLGQYNSTCSPASTSFTNSISNISSSSNVVSSFQPVCLIVNPKFCYESPTDTVSSVPVKHGITLLGRAGAANGNWPMLRNSAYTVLESKTKGLVITRNSNPEGSIAIPVVGMMVFDTDENSGKGCLKIYTGSGSGEGWKCFNTQTCP
ncbi:hypothetical protein [Chryseobacterium sp.]|uniref:DUF7933 domain-containing protein n=1 Tax=Chryseobacterium sp. TaxID=1871047 RepID=UPI0035C70C78